MRHLNGQRVAHAQGTEAWRLATATSFARGGELAKLGGWLVALSKKGKPNQRVGDVFKNDDELRKAAA